MRAVSRSAIWVAPGVAEMVVDSCRRRGRTCCSAPCDSPSGRLYAFDVAEATAPTWKPQAGALTGLSNASGAHRVGERPEGEATGRQA